MSEMLGYQFVQNAVAAGVLASLLCGLVGTFVVVKRLVFVSGGVSHAAFGGLGIFYFLGWPPLAGAAASALLAAVVLAGRGRSGNRSQDALIGILWAVGMAVGVLFMARTPGYAPNLATYLFGDILAVTRPLLIALAVFVAGVVAFVTLFFKELLAVAFDEEFARTQGVATRTFLLVLMALIALSVVLLIQVVGVILAIALLTIPPVIGLALARSFRTVLVLAVVVALVITQAGLALSFAWDLPSGPTIVLLGFALLLVVRAGTRLGKRRRLVGVLTLLAVWVIASGAGVSGVGVSGVGVSGVGPTGAGPTGAITSGAIADDSVPSVAEGPGEAYLTSIRRLELLGEARVDTRPIDGVPLGGLSGLTYDAASGHYYAISDDRADRGPARFYTLDIDLSDGRLDPGDVRVLGFTRLAISAERDFGSGRIDPEAIALTSHGTLIVASEGNANLELEPFLREFGLDGLQRRDFPLGPRYAPRADGQSGVRNNLALESAAITPSGRFLFSATENALAQDGPKSDLRNASPGRVLRYDLERGRIDAEFLYWIDPVAEEPRPADQFSTAGLVDLIALDDRKLLVLERSFSFGRGHDVRLYEADVTGATDILEVDGLASRGVEGIVPVSKRLLIHIDRLGVTPDNLEGMALGPPLPDGRATLLLVSDDNFNPLIQVSQLLAFALSEETPDLPAIRGAGHRSPFEGEWLRGVSGIVTVVDDDPRSGGFWIRGGADGDREGATSDGLYVDWPAGGVAPGDRVRVDGAVRADGGREPATARLDAARVDIVASGRPAAQGEGTVSVRRSFRSAPSANRRANVSPGSSSCASTGNPSFP